jgi:hypothetical protein
LSDRTAAGPDKRHGVSQRLQAGEECNTTQTYEPRFFWTICRIPVSPFVIIVKAGTSPAEYF